METENKTGVATDKSECAGSTCSWFSEEEDFYSTQCGRMQIHIRDVAGDELYKYCPHCAGVIVASDDKMKDKQKSEVATDSLNSLVGPGIATHYAINPSHPTATVCGIVGEIGTKDKALVDCKRCRKTKAFMESNAGDEPRGAKLN